MAKDGSKICIISCFAMVMALKLNLHYILMTSHIFKVAW